jgi:hypothetical protein
MPSPREPEGPQGLGAFTLSYPTSVRKPMKPPMPLDSHRRISFPQYSNLESRRRKASDIRRARAALLDGSRSMCGERVYGANSAWTEKTSMAWVPLPV